VATGGRARLRRCGHGAEVKRGHEPGDIRRRFMRLTQRHALALRLEQAARHLRRQRQEAGQ
jgi:hypothetical protein